MLELLEGRLLILFVSSAPWSLHTYPRNLIFCSYNYFIKASTAIFRGLGTKDKSTDRTVIPQIPSLNNKLKKKQKK